jgi:hypothetical protein
MLGLSNKKVIFVGHVTFVQLTKKDDKVSIWESFCKTIKLKSDSLLIDTVWGLLSFPEFLEKTKSKSTQLTYYKVYKIHE